MHIEAKLKGIPNEDIIQGYPGIAATWPRVAGTVELRSILPTKATPAPGASTAIEVVRVSVGVFRTDSIVVPSHRPSPAASKREQSFLVTRQKEIYHAKQGTPKIYALDIPFTLSLPTNRVPTASISLPKMLESTYNVFVTVESVSPATNTLSTDNFQFPIRLKRFDTLSTFGTFHKPLTGEVASSDHLVSLEWSLPVSAYGPGDTMTMSLRAQPNKDWPKAKKVKLKRLSVELLQSTRFIVDKGSPTSQQSPHSHRASIDSNATKAESSEINEMQTNTRIAKSSRDFTSAEQDKRMGIASAYDIDVYIPTSLKAGGDKSNVLPKDDPGVGYEGKIAFTNSSSLFSIEFKLIIKARFAHAKDIETVHSITIAQFDHPTCMVYMNSLVEAAQAVKSVDSRPHPPRLWGEPLDSRIKIA